jgi:LacI family transcriptional regulator
MLTQRQVDGVLLVPAGSATAPLRLLRSRRVPVVVLDRRVRSRQVDQVRTDSVADSRRLVRHLTDLGHQRIAMLSGRRAISTATDRVAGYQVALREAGITADARLVRYGGYGIAGGYQMATEVLALDPPPTALFAANNFIAFGALRRLRELRLHVPEDVSLVCFDDLPEDWLIDPFLTVVDQPAYEMGRRAAELLLRRLDGTPPHAAQSIVLPGELVERRSTAAPSAIPVAVA